MVDKAGDKKAPPATTAVAAAPSTIAPAGTKSATGTAGNKKKRGSSKQPTDNKAAKKKKKEPVALPVDPVPEPVVPVAPATKATNVSVANTTTTSNSSSDSNLTSGSNSTGGITDISDRPLLDQVLYRLTEGIPQTELKAVVREADDCEKALLQEIQLLEDALKAEKKGKDELSSSVVAPDATSQEASTVTVDSILESPLTPLDRAFTLSSLLGRLRDDLALPSIRKPLPAAVAVAAASKKKKPNANPAPTYPQLVALVDHPNYTRDHTATPAAAATSTAVPPPPVEQQLAQLLHVWRKIASHRTAMVFRRPVKPEEAPGYTDRILFPMDLSLVRKMIVARILTSYSDVHQRMRLISHNCVKYNGRESDYGIVAREFEAIVDEYITTAVHQSPQQQQQQSGAPLPGSGRSSPKPGGSGRSSPWPGSGGGGSGRSSPSHNKQLASAPSTASMAAAANAAVEVLADSKKDGVAGLAKNP